jgi:hypothetical protein
MLLMAQGWIYAPMLSWFTSDRLRAKARCTYIRNDVLMENLRHMVLFVNFFFYYYLELKGAIKMLNADRASVALLFR